MIDRTYSEDGAAAGYDFYVKNDSDYHHYQAFGEQARTLAKEFYRTLSVVKRDATSGREVLAVSKMMLSRILHFLLVDGQTVRVWEKKDSSDKQSAYELTKEASPGNLQAVEGMGGQLLELSASATLAAVCTSPAPNGGLLVGVVVAHPSMRAVRVYADFLDAQELSVVESVLVQTGVKECLVVDGIGNGSKSLFDGDWDKLGPVGALVRRCGLAGTVVPKGWADVTALRTELVTEVARLRIPEGEVEATAVSVTDAIVPMNNGARALHAVLKHLEAWKQHACEGKFSFEVVSAGNILQYDMSAAQALNMFPSKQENTAVILNDAHTTSTTPSAPAGGGEADDVFDEDAAWVPPAAPVAPSSSSSSSSSGASHAFNLLSLLRATLTPMGTRALTALLQQPSSSHAELTMRHDVVQALLLTPASRSALRSSRECLKGFPDLERSAAQYRRSPPKASLSDLLSTYSSFQRLRAVMMELEAVEGATQDAGAKASVRYYLLDPLRSRVDASVNFQALVEELVDPAALTARSATGLPRCFRKRAVQVRASFTPELTQLKGRIEELEGALLSERDKTTKALKLDAKNVHLERSASHGLHLRVTKKDAAKVSKLAGTTLLSAQKSGSLFTTAQFATYARAYASTTAQYQQAQEAVVKQAVCVAATYEPVMRQAAMLVASVDCLCAFAELAARYDWTRPTLQSHANNKAALSSQSESDTAHLSFSGLTHPLLQARIGSRCVPSDFALGTDDRIAIITGPNMGGKSTFIRAVATSVLLAQVGCFVPARHATLPLVDRIFVRMGASDSSTEGLSTFLTEMRQMNTILRDATPNSLVLIDELGRGTSTHDGFGIAWAVLERLKEIGCTVLFATHFHELTEMAVQSDNSGVVNYHVSAHAPADTKEVVMLYAVEPGVCERSFGIHVARTVDFPQEIIDEAEALALDMSGAAGSRSSQLLSGKVGGEASVGDKRPRPQDV